jgi:hypothetical protein
MRRAGTSMPKRWAYQPLMRSRSGSRPRACVYCVRPSRIAFSAACCTSGGAVKSGSPMFRKIMGVAEPANSRAIRAAALPTSIT